MDETIELHEDELKSQVNEQLISELLEEERPTPMPGIEAGKKIGNFTIKKKLGVGGMGEVWLAHQEAMDRFVALKILAPVFVQDEKFVQRFMKEVQLSAKMEHPNIVIAHDAGIDNDVHYLAMSFVDGEDVEEKLERDGQISEEESLLIVKKIAGALKYVWDNYQMIHRDIKPSNIMIDSKGEPRLMDMGISKSLQDNHSMTMTGAIVGTPYYISPEQAKAEASLDFHADMYSLGATLYHITTGSLPYSAPTTMGVLTKHIMEPLPAPKLSNENLSTPCAKLMEIMLAKNVDDRHKTWDDLIYDIDLVLHGKSPEAPLPEERQLLYSNKTPLKKNHIYFILGGLGCLIILILGVLVVKKFKKSDAKNKPIAKIEKIEKTEIKNINKKTVIPKIKTVIKKEPIEKPKLSESDIKWNSAIEFAKTAISEQRNFNQAIKNFEIIKDRKYEIKSKNEISKLLNARINIIEKLKSEIIKKATDLTNNNNNFADAANLFRTYSAQFANETKLLRKKELEYCLNAPSKLKKHYNKIASFVLNSEIDKAKLITDNFILTGEYKYVKNKIDKLIVLLDNIKLDNEQGKNSIASRILLAISKIKTNNYETAKISLQGTKQYSEYFITALENIESKAFENNAENALKKIISNAGLQIDKLDKLSLLSELKQNKLTKEISEKIIAEIADFKIKFKNTKFIKKNIEITTILINNAEASLKRGGLFNDEQGAIDNITGAAQDALDIFLPEDDGTSNDDPFVK